MNKQKMIAELRKELNKWDAGIDDIRALVDKLAEGDAEPEESQYPKGLLVEFSNNAEKWTGAVLYGSYEPEKTNPHMSARGSVWKHARPYTGPVVIAWQPCNGARPPELTDDDEKILYHIMGESKSVFYFGEVSKRFWHNIDGYARVSFLMPPNENKENTNR